MKWKGYTYEESTWEPESNFKPHTLRDYHKKRKREKEEDSGSESSEEDDRTAWTAHQRREAYGKNLSTPFEGPFSRASSLREEPLGIHESHTFSPTMGFLTVWPWIHEIGPRYNPTLSHETLHVHTHAQAWRGVLDPTSKEDRYSARIYIERSYRDLGNRRSEYNYILHYLEWSLKEPKCTKVRFPRLRVRTCTQRAPTSTQVPVRKSNNVQIWFWTKSDWNPDFQYIEKH